jgi:tetratricopeptide (TPR) repeat protein
MYAALGRNLLQVRFDLEGFEAVRKSIELKPNYALGHYTLAAALDWQNRDDVRFVQRQQRDRSAPRLADVLQRYVLLRPDSAETLLEYQQAARFEPENAFYHAYLGAALAVRHRDGEALAEYRRAAELQPNNASYKAKMETLKQRVAAGAAK